MLQPLHEAVRSDNVEKTLVLFALIASIFVHSETFFSMASIWLRSETFAHGLFIAPISIYLIWQKREQLKTLPIDQNFLVLIPLAATGFVWLIADMVDVSVVKQLAVVAMLPLILWLLLGSKFVWSIAFPLLFLFFAVPAGEALIPRLMDITAAITVWAIQLTGIPIYREDLYFTIPSGKFQVAVACSGIRYLIAAVTFGTLYAYLSFHSYYRRAAYILISIILPIIANGLRAYLIVMIAHLSELKHAVGFDHLIYGWLFFGVVILLLLAAGRAMAERPAGSATDTGEQSPHAPARPQPVRHLLAFTSALSLVSVFPFTAYLTAANHPGASPVSISLPTQIDGWAALPGEQFDWQPSYQNASEEWHGAYAKNDRVVGVNIVLYRGRVDGADLISSENVMIREGDPVWRVSETGDRALEGIFGLKQVSITKLSSMDDDLLIWHWYLVNGVQTSNRYIGKLHEAIARLLGRQNSLGIAIHTRGDFQAGVEDETLESFVRQTLGSIIYELQPLIEN